MPRTTANSARTDEQQGEAVLGASAEAAADADHHGPNPEIQESGEESAVLQADAEMHLELTLFNSV